VNAARPAARHPLRSQCLEQGFGIWHGKGEVRNPHLVELQRGAGDGLPGMASNRQSGLLPSPKTQADATSALARLLVIVEPPALGGVGVAVEQDLHAQGVPVKGQSFSMSRVQMAM
jgi:hypothetical protein